MSIHRAYLRKRLGKAAPGNVLLPFRVTHKHYVPVTVHREQSVKKEYQQDATI